MILHAKLSFSGHFRHSANYRRMKNISLGLLMRLLAKAVMLVTP
jgi:hypothetical protein